MLEIVHTLQDIPSIVITKDFRTDHWSEIVIHKRATMTRFKVNEFPILLKLKILIFNNVQNKSTIVMSCDLNVFALFSIYYLHTNQNNIKKYVSHTLFTGLGVVF